MSHVHSCACLPTSPPAFPPSGRPAGPPAALPDSINLFRCLSPAATVVVLGILPIQIPTPDGTVHVVDDIIAGANEETAAYVARQCSPRLVYKGQPGLGPGRWQARSAGSAATEVDMQ